MNIGELLQKFGWKINVSKFEAIKPSKGRIYYSNYGWYFENLEKISKGPFNICKAVLMFAENENV